MDRLLKFTSQCVDKGVTTDKEARQHKRKTHVLLMLHLPSHASPTNWSFLSTQLLRFPYVALIDTIEAEDSLICTTFSSSFLDGGNFIGGAVTGESTWRFSLALSCASPFSFLAFFIVSFVLGLLHAEVAATGSVRCPGLRSFVLRPSIIL